MIVLRYNYCNFSIQYLYLPAKITYHVSIYKKYIPQVGAKIRKDMQQQGEISNKDMQQQKEISQQRYAIAERDFLAKICNSRKRFPCKDMQQQGEISYKRYATAERDFLEKICNSRDRFPRKDMQQQKEISQQRCASVGRDFLEKICNSRKRFHIKDLLQYIQEGRYLLEIYVCFLLVEIVDTQEAVPHKVADQAGQAGMDNCRKK